MARCLSYSRIGTERTGVRRGLADGMGPKRISKARPIGTACTKKVVREYAHVYKDAVKVEGSLEVRKTWGDSTMSNPTVRTARTGN